MIKFFKRLKSRRGVSPVIAVVLLIALTVAAVAVIWGITNNFLATDVPIEIDNESATTSGVTFDVLVPTADATITGATINNGTDYTIAASSISPTLINSGDSTTVTLNANMVSSQSYTVTINFSIDGETQDEQFQVTVA